MKNLWYKRWSENRRYKTTVWGRYKRALHKIENPSHQIEWITNWEAYYRIEDAVYERTSYGETEEVPEYITWKKLRLHQYK